MLLEGATVSRLLTSGFVAAALVCGAWLGLKQTMGVASGLDRIEDLILDWRFLLAGARPAPPGVVIVAVDDQTLSEAEGHNLSRETLARIVRAIADFHPRAVALDIAFPDSKGANPDAELANALRSTPSVVASIGNFGEDDLSGKQPSSGVCSADGFHSRPHELLEHPRSELVRVLGQPLAQGSRRLAFGRPGGQCRLGRHHKPVAVLHQRMAKIGKMALLPVTFLEQARILVRRRSVRLIRSLRLAVIRLPVAPR